MVRRCVLSSCFVYWYIYIKIKYEFEARSYYFSFFLFFLDSLSITLLHSLLQSVPKDTKPAELSKMVMALSQKSSKSLRHAVPKSSKLPIRRGSDVAAKVL